MAQLIGVFRLSVEKLADAANFWALMFFILALGVAACYSVLGYCTNRFSMVSSN
jgi:hypothetical protein